MSYSVLGKGQSAVENFAPKSHTTTKKRRFYYIVDKACLEGSLSRVIRWVYHIQFAVYHGAVGHDNVVSF